MTATMAMQSEKMKQFRQPHADNELTMTMTMEGDGTSVMVLSLNMTLSNDTITLQGIPLYTCGVQFILPGVSSDCIILTGMNRTAGQAYTFDPLVNLTALQVPGTTCARQAALNRQSSPQNLDSIVWPHAATSAEVFWSGPGSNISATLLRLHELGYHFRNCV
ncbi:hypothetical protein EDB89DRAFT_1913601 [Lactarius sanguifluus]|nr:hypothetical protein EDB89DRAFT_1913601 [Lactarius sanguifluus]